MFGRLAIRILTTALAGALCLGALKVVEADPALSFSPTLLDFGKVQIGTTATLTVTATNIGDDPFQVQASQPRVFLNGSDIGFGVQWGPDGVFPLQPGASFTIIVQFSPTAGANKHGVCVVEDFINDAFVPVGSFEVQGKGVH